MDTVLITESLAEVEGQSWAEQKATVDLRLCRACSAEMRDHDKFCRHCGARRTGAIATPPASATPSAFATSRLRADTFNSVSAPLLNAIASGAQAGAARLDSRRLRRAVSALIVVPLWLMIVLLSPIDAYATAKAIAGQHQTPHRNFGTNGPS
ncbi:MAG TPA: zinc ribbon domain-containing protein [Blastocatellia bacterium]|jgi:hypothetical protein